MPLRGPGRQSFDDEGFARVRICARLALAEGNQAPRAVALASGGDDYGFGEIRQAGIGLGGLDREDRADVTLPGAAMPGMKARRQGATGKALERRIAVPIGTRNRPFHRSRRQAVGYGRSSKFRLVLSGKATIEPRLSSRRGDAPRYDFAP